MTTEQLFEKVSGGDKEAFQFLTAAYEHLWNVHSFINHREEDPHKFIGLMAKTNQVFSLPFYQKHAEQLRIPVLKLVNGLVNDVPRSLLLDVAFITLGFEGARKLLVELKGKE